MNKSTEYSDKDLNKHWIIVIVFNLTLVSYNIICHYFAEQIQIEMDESQRIFIRTVFYIMAIIVLPITSLIRHILLRLNQTMPGNHSAKDRYLTTIIVTQSMMELVAIAGLVMFVLGDSYNTLYIFTIMALLGMFLHRPKMEEYVDIITCLKNQ